MVVVVAGAERGLAFRHHAREEFPLQPIGTGSLDRVGSGPRCEQKSWRVSNSQLAWLLIYCKDPGESCFGEGAEVIHTRDACSVLGTGVLLPESIALIKTHDSV